MQQAKAIARVTMTHRDGSKTVVEVHSNADYQAFYHFYKRAAGKRAKQHIRAAQRSEAPDLESLANRQKETSERMAQGAIGTKLYGDRKIVSIKVVVLKKKLYRHFLECSVDQLPGYRPVVSRSLGDSLNFGHPRNPYAPKGVGTTRDIPRFRARMKGTFRY